MCQPIINMRRLRRPYGYVGVFWNNGSSHFILMTIIIIIFIRMKQIINYEMFLITICFQRSKFIAFRVKSNCGINDSIIYGTLFIHSIYLQSICSHEQIKGDLIMYTVSTIIILLCTISVIPYTAQEGVYRTTHNLGSSHKDQVTYKKYYHNLGCFFKSP